MPSSRSTSAQQRPLQRRRNERTLGPARAGGDRSKGTHLNGRKISCKVCILGHRSTTCKHDGERDMYYVRKAGRPVMTCNHAPCYREECQSRDKNQPCCEHVICDRQNNDHVLARAAPPVVREDPASEVSNGEVDGPSSHEYQHIPNGESTRPDRTSNASTVRRPTGGVTHIATYEVRMDANPSADAVDASETIMGNAQNLLAQIHGVQDQRTFEPRPATNPNPGAVGMTAENMFTPHSNPNDGFDGLDINMNFGISPFSFTGQLPDRTRVFPAMELEQTEVQAPTNSSFVFNDTNLYASSSQQPIQSINRNQFASSGLMNFESPGQLMMNSLANPQFLNMPASNIQQEAYPIQMNQEVVLNDEWIMENVDQHLDNLLRLSPIIASTPMVNAAQQTIPDAVSYESLFTGQVETPSNLPVATQGGSSDSSLFNSSSFHDPTLDSSYLSSVWSSSNGDNPELQESLDKIDVNNQSLCNDHVGIPQDST